VFANLDACLKAAGATFADVVKLNFYVTDVAYLPAIRVARDEYVDTANPPASTAVQVVALFSPDALLEVEAYAIV
jgi:enamine deaminase RidA (YjgF/YER057c/UK114 family)